MEEDSRLNILRKIFDILVWNKQVPPCILTWIGDKLRRQIWQLRVIPFQPVDCKFSKAVDDPDLRQYECGFNNGIGDKTGGFKRRSIGKGCHSNLHQVINCLHRVGVDYDNIKVEESFRGYKADILGEVENDKYIVVELGELSTIEKFFLTDDKLVKEFWFGDSERFIYSLSRKVLMSEQMLDEEYDRYLSHMANYYKEYCVANRQLKECLRSRSIFNCVDVRKEAHDFLGIPYL
jgi:hypothetical protein